LTDDNGDSNDSDVDMAECGACRSVIPLDSGSCPDCGVSFSGVAEDDMGECGACGTLVPIDSKSCSQCGVHFVLDDLTTALSTWMKAAGMNISELFGIVDSDNDGKLTADEVKNALIDRNLAFLGINELDRFLSQIDLNDDGVISFAELAAALSMPWTPPVEMTVLEPDVTDDDSDDGDQDLDSEVDDNNEETESHDDDESDNQPSDDEEEQSDDEDEDELRYTERVLERVMKSHGITDKEAFLKHATSSDKDGNKFLREDELTEAAILWNATSDSDDDEQTDDGNQSEGTESDDDEDASDNDEEDVDSDEEDDEEDVDSDEEDDEEDVDSDDEEEEVDSDDEEEEVDSDDEEEEVDSDEEDDDDSDDDLFDDGSDTESKPEGPAGWQRFLMRNYENVFPVLYTIGALFVGLWLVNAAGLIVDGSGGPIAYDGDPISEISADTNWVDEVTLDTGDIYPCDKDIQESGCKNSLTPFAGENGSLSMPAGFHWDGILFMVLGLCGLGVIAYLQMQIKQMRAEHRRKKSPENEENESTDSADEDSEDNDADDEGDDSDDDESEEDEDSGDDESDDDEDSDDDESDDEEDGIDIGSRVGVEDEDGDWYGVVIEFDDDEDSLVVKREDDGEEYVVDWDSLFQDE